MNNSQTFSKPITCVIIDDDPFIQDLLKDKLSQYFPEINITGLGSNGKEGVENIILLQPDLVFLDVEMTDMTGFEMLSRLETINFKTIFITSYKHYAIKAIRFNALDYLLKPFDLEELKNAIKRFKANYHNVGSSEQIDLALNNIKTKNISEQVLTLKTQQGDLQLALKDIIAIEGDRNYSNIHLIGNRKELVSKTLSDLEDLLDGKDFFRCHKSFLINKTHIVDQPNSISVNLSNGIKVPISRRKKESFVNWLKTAKVL